MPIKLLPEVVTKSYSFERNRTAAMSGRFLPECWDQDKSHHIPQWKWGSRRQSVQGQTWYDFTSSYHRPNACLLACLPTCLKAYQPPLKVLNDYWVCLPACLSARKLDRPLIDLRQNCALRPYVSQSLYLPSYMLLLHTTHRLPKVMNLQIENHSRPPGWKQLKFEMWGTNPNYLKMCSRIEDC